MKTEVNTTNTQADVALLEKRLRSAVVEISMLRDMLNEVRQERDELLSRLEDDELEIQLPEDMEAVALPTDELALLKEHLDELEAMSRRLEEENACLRQGSNRLINKPQPIPAQPPAMQLVKFPEPPAEALKIDQAKMDAIQEGRLKIKTPQETQGLIRRLDANRKAGFVSNIFGKKKS